MQTHAIKVRKGCVISILRPTFDQAKNEFYKQQNLEKKLRIRILWRFRCREQVRHYEKANILTLLFIVIAKKISI